MMPPVSSLKPVSAQLLGVRGLRSFIRHQKSLEVLHTGVAISALS